MARYPGATWRDAHVSRGDRSNGAMQAYDYAVLHVNVSNGNLFNWVNNPANEMSCHFEVYKNGSIEQYVDTSMSSWCQTNGNNTGISIETEGYPTEPLTPQQCDAITGLLAWLNITHGIPLQISDSVSEPGFAWHGMGGASWGGHPSCPGDLRKAQRQQILDKAQPHSGSGDGSKITTLEEDEDMPYAFYVKTVDPNGNVPKTYVIDHELKSKLHLIDPDADKAIFDLTQTMPTYNNPREGDTGAGRGFITVAWPWSLVNSIPDVK